MGSIPRLHRYYETLRHLSVRPPGLPGSARRYRPCALLVRSRAARERRRGGAWALVFGPPTDCSRTETVRSPRFLGSLRVRTPCCSTPAGRSAPRQTGALHAAVASGDSTGSRDCCISGLDHTACALAVYASQCGSPRHHARLAFGWWLASTERDWLPARLLREVSSAYVMRNPPLPSFPGTPPERVTVDARSRRKRAMCSAPKSSRAA